MAEQKHTFIGRAYLTTIPVLGVALVGWSLNEAIATPPTSGWFVLTIATALIGAYTVKIPGLVVRLSLSEPTVFLSTLLYGPAAGTLTAAIDALVMSMRLVPRLRTPHRVLFNVGALAASVFAASLLFFRLSGLDPRAPTYGAIEEFVGPLYAFALAVFLLNSWIVAVALGVERSESAVLIWARQFPWLAANYLASASIAAILVVFSQSIDFGLVALLLPLLVVSFLAFRTTLGRLDDANTHLSEVNRLYLSTIETLAMAIDAKDQVTHGHIRRVQRFAVGLAQSLGVTEERQLRAIEAAALLHDMGKLAIPEFILNKPGKLTAREFSVMKTHAAVGADILSSIQFPYPVVPIVRHHHENWDGSGYPDGLKGSDIPIGARILSVVDCYDALTSDRPYRPAMPAEDALEILTQRRGSMYDSLVVDIFVRDHAALCVSAEIHDIPALVLAGHADPTSPQTWADAHTPNTAPLESLRLLAGLSPFPGGPPLASVCRQLTDNLRAIASFDTAAIFVLDDTSSDAEAVFVDGSVARSILGMRIPVAERLTGWVAAHRTAVWNSEAVLDLASVGTRASLAFGSSLPLSVDDTLVGVLSLYGRADQEISVGQRRALESLLPTMAVSLWSALQRPGAAIDCADDVTRTAALAALDALLSHDRHVNAATRGAILAVSVSPRAQDSSHADRVELVGPELAARLSPRGARNRCVLRLAPGQFLLCSLDGASAQDLEHEVASANTTKLLRAFVVSSTAVNNSLELQDRVRTAVDTITSRSPQSRASRIH
ncbi:MAG: HD domain-containing protein [Acidobacteria bacterium]|nr:HD domain-containing protein [Acidobacteriota bacterium]